MLLFGVKDEDLFWLLTMTMTMTMNTMMKTFSGR